MKIFMDTANVAEIAEMAALGVVYGVTTNPSLIAKSGRTQAEVIPEICSLVDGPVSAEVISTDCEGMVAEARRLMKISDKVVVKIPCIAEGLKAVKILAKEGIKTNVTLVFSLPQALMAARAGATYVSPFIGRLDDIGENGVALVETWLRFSASTISIRRLLQPASAIWSMLKKLCSPVRILQLFLPKF